MQRFPVTLRAAALAAAVAALPACQLAPSGPAGSKRLHASLTEAATAWDLLAAGQPNPAAEAAYERAVASILTDLQKSSRPRTWSGTITTGAGPSRFAFQPSAPLPDPVQPTEFAASLADEIRLADSVKIKGSVVAAADGIGVPAVLRRGRDPELVRKYPFLPPNGASAPVTAVVSFGKAAPDQPRPATLHLYRPQAELRSPTVSVGGRQFPLAWNYTAAVTLGMGDGTLDKFGLRGLLKPESTLDACQVYRLDTYDPKRIPVVFVHGLVSDPHIWANAINAIYADPILRQHYQPWYFMYPTGLPIPGSSRYFREWLDKSRDLLDPDHNDPGMNNMVLVGHSMGGLLSRMQVIDPGDTLWNAFFKLPPEKLRMSSKERQQFVSSLKFSSRPWVKRAVFVAVPHRGSRIANLGIVRWATKLVKLPSQSLSVLTNVVRLNADSVASEMMDMANFISVGNLSPGHPFFRGLEPIPLNVPHHSIIGDRGKGGGKDSTDGVVPYWSSHLDSAASETFVPHPHSCVEAPETVAEITRILKLHLQSTGRAR